MDWKFEGFKYPSPWYDENIIFGLYQRFKRSREADPTNYNQKLSFWTVLIQDYCVHHHIVVISEKSLKEHFTRTLKCTGQIMKPECIGTVLWEMLNTPSSLQYLSDFSTMGKLSKMVGTGFDWFVKKPVSWSWNFITGTRTRDRPIKTVENDNTDFVLSSNVNKLSEAFLDWINSNQFSHLRPSQDHNILQKCHFDEALNSFFPDNDSRNFMRSWLQANQRVVAFCDTINSQTIEVVKFSSRLSNESTVQFTDDDRSFLVVIQLREVISKLEREAKHLQVSLDERKSAVRVLIREKKKAEALRLLRRGKVIEHSLEQRHAQIEKVESLLLQIESSKGNRQLLGALSLANSAMKDALGDSRDSVEDVLTGLHDAFDQQQEVNDALADVGNITHDGDDLEAELDELLSGSTGKITRYNNRNFPCDADIDSQLADLDLSLELPDVSNLPMPSSAHQNSLSSDKRRTDIHLS